MAIAPIPSPTPSPDPAPTPYRFSLEEFVRAFDAGVFSGRVEFIDGEVWPVVIGHWHGRATGRVMRALPNDHFVVTSESLASAGSLPDPDCWVCRAEAQPVTQLSPHVVAYDPADVLLVIEVSDETVTMDLGTKAGIYARAGYACYWVVTLDGIYEHTEPSQTGYKARRLYGPGERIPVAYAGTELAVDDLIAPS